MALSSLFWRYTAFQVPGWILVGGGGALIHHWFDVPLWVPFGALGVWVAKDYALYPFVKDAYRLDLRQPIERLVGEIGRAVEPLSPTGYIRIRGELWRATTTQLESIEAGQVVEITDVDGPTLLVAERYLPQSPTLGDDSENMDAEQQSPSNSPSGYR